MQKWIVAIFISFSTSSLALPVIQLDPTIEYFLINEVDYLLDPEHSITIEEARNSSRWQPNTASNINFGFINQTVWLHFKLQATTNEKWIIKIPYPLVDELTFYSYINGEAQEPIYTGDTRPFKNRPVNHPHFVFPYQLLKGDLLEGYIKVKTKGSAEVPLQIITEQAYIKDNRLRVFLLGWMNGILLVMMLYNLVIYFFTKDKIYIAYVFTVAMYIIGTAMYNGTAFQYIFPNRPDLSEPLYPVLNGFYHFFNVLFMIMFLNLLDRNKFIKYIFLFLFWSALLLIPLSFILKYEVVVPLQVLLALTLNIVGFICGFYYALKGEKNAIFFSVAWGLYILGMLIANFKALGYLESNWFTLYVYQIGTFIQVSVLSVALAQKIESQRSQSIETLSKYKTLYNSALSGQFTLNRKGIIIDANPAFAKMLNYNSTEEIIQRSKENHRKFFHQDEHTPRQIFKQLSEKGFITDMEIQLKTRLNEMKWFSVSVQPIKDEKNNVTSYQGSVIDIQERKTNEKNKKRAMRERMLAMEHLVVGICHEINTPLGVSNTAISQLKDDFNFLNNSLDNNELTKAIFSQRLEYEVEAIDIIQNNLDKINHLISEFKEASVLQKGYKYGEGNIRYILDEIQLILERKIGKENINIEYEEDIEFIGYPRAITDLLTNLYTNSMLHGFEDRSGAIKISVNIIKDNIQIIFRDNGVGIASHRIRDIFNPFYTSKRGSKGSIGLGLFQVFNIATQLLDGNIEVENTHPGVAFTITFPIHLKPLEERANKVEAAPLRLIST